MSGVISDSNLKTILDNPSAYIESSSYFSWERFFTALLVQQTKETYLQYTKKKLNNCYLQSDVKEKILAQMREIDFEPGEA